MITMFVKESYGEKNTEPNKQDIDEDEEETLSFYEFSMNNDADAWEDSSGDSQNSSFKSSEQEEDDYFEFSSEELRTNTTTSYQPENILFCGKIIPYKQPISEGPKIVVKEKKHRRRGLFRWRWNFTSSNKSRTSRKDDDNGAKHPCTTSNAKKELQSESPKQKYSTRKRIKIRGFSVHKMSIFTNPTKSKLFLYLFGMTRFRSEMELRDIKNRQRRRSPSSTLFRLEGSDAKERECKGAWGLLRALSCGGGGANAVMQASVGLIPQV